MKDVWLAVRSGRAPSERQIALGRIAATHAVETAAVVTRKATLAGGSALLGRAPIAQVF